MQLISSPARAWEEISLEDRRKVFTAFVYPMIGLCGLSIFIGSLVAKGWGGPQSFQYAMTQCCAVAVSLFGGATGGTSEREHTLPDFLWNYDPPVPSHNQLQDSQCHP